MNATDMKICGNNDAKFSHYSQEKGFFGYNDILKGEALIRNKYQKIKIPIHISKNLWSTFTGKLREYCLPWRWKAAYLDNGSQLVKILVCTSVRQGSFPFDTDLIGDLFALKLFESKNYVKSCGRELLPVQNNKIGPAYLYSHIYRSRGLFSMIKYQLLRFCSKEWKETVLQVGDLSEKILIKNSDEEALRSKYNLS